MNTKKQSSSSLAMNTLSDIPTPNKDAKQIVGLVKHSGKVSGYKLSDGSLLSKADGVLLAKQGGLQGVGISKRKGNEYLKSIPDQSDGNNLSSLPTVTG